MQARQSRAQLVENEKKNLIGIVDVEHHRPLAQLVPLAQPLFQKIFLSAPPRELLRPEDARKGIPNS
ncbi:MAG: hypothetical protein K2J12_08245 [Muribaculaceae bacterium]|nr:hypothetical protein [Muribaculaceae bacterium]